MEEARLVIRIVFKIVRMEIKGGCCQGVQMGRDGGKNAGQDVFICSSEEERSAFFGVKRHLHTCRFTPKNPQEEVLTSSSMTLVPPAVVLKTL